MLRKIEAPVLKDLFLSLLSAVLLIFSFPKFNLEILAWFAFVPLFFALRNKSKFKAFLFSYLAGVIFWFGTIYWLVHVTLPGMIILVLYLALYFGLFGFIISTIGSELSILNLLFIPSLWVIFEYIRSYLFTGFPWAILGHSQYLNLPFIQIADITGAWGISFVLVMVNVTIYSIIGKGKKVIFLTLFCLILIFSYGYYKLYNRQQATANTPIRISVIQGNIPQELKWDEGSRNFIMERYFALTRQAIQDKPDLIIWPEASLPVIKEEDPGYFNKVCVLAKDINIPLLLGMVTSEGGSYFNSAVLISGEGKQSKKYDKLHLVPFGEYIPLRKTLPFLETIVPIGDFTSGRDYVVFKTSSSLLQVPLNFSVLICFEDLFPQLSRQFVKKGADFLVNITNDAWFGKTTSPYQHLLASVFRAIENRVIVVRSANTGISGFISPAGKIIALVKSGSGEKIFSSGYRTQEARVLKNNSTFYNRFGDVFIFLLFIYFFCSIFRLIYRRFS